MLQIRFSNHRLIKISILYLHIKPEVKKTDTTAMSTAINKACIGWLHENCYLVENEAGFSPHLQRFSQTVGLGKEVGQSIHDGGNNQNKRRGNIFGKMRNTVGILQGDNSAGYCFQISRDYDTENVHHRQNIW